ncbi:MAG: glycosyltransferase family 2 protein [Spirochaetaceae bacterium]|jgi:chlorobactene glucosyltransferase|nr:glycosyltransferase family 2 protein [Spirochaetaceae bacterium]
MNLEVLIFPYCAGLITVVAYFFIMSVTNVIGMRLATSKPTIKSGPFVSVMVPARNEAANIEQCLERLLHQDYANYEVLVIDDNSSDCTYCILERIAAVDPRLQIFKGKPLNDDWYGKPFALQQLAEHAKGDIFLFTDADTIHSPTSVSWAVTNIEHTKADLISGFVGQILKNFGERITVPIIFLLTGFVIPLFLNRFVRSGYFSAAVGQYIVIKRDVFINTGGFEAIKKKTSEDIYMSRYIKECGYQTEFLDLSDQVFCRMYFGFTAAVQGIGKNIYDFLGKNIFLLFFIVLLSLLFFLMPFPLLIWSIVTQNPMLHFIIIINVLATLTWLVLFIARRISWYNALLWPFMYCSLAYMILWSGFRTISKRGFSWKGRIVN